MGKSLKWGFVCVTVFVLFGFAVFGAGFLSYVRSSARSVQDAVQASVPMELELQRARDMVDQIIPELRANIQVIAREEVEVAHLRKEIDESDRRLVSLRTNVAKLRDSIDESSVVLTSTDSSTPDTNVAKKLSREFSQYKHAQSILESKRRLLEKRELSLQAARNMLEKTRARKAELEQKIESMVAQYRLLKTQSVGTSSTINDSRLAEADRELNKIQKRLDTAKLVLQHQNDVFFEIPVETEIDASELLAEIDEHLSEPLASTQKEMDHGDFH